MKRPLLIITVFLAAGVAGWFSAVPEEEKSPVIRREAATDKQPVSRYAGVPEPMGHGSGDLAALEKELLRALNPGAGTFSGERLAELCLENHASDLPGPNMAFSYARGWAIQNPQGMFEWFQSRGEFTLQANSSNYSFLQTIFSEWAKKDPDAALAAALSCRAKRDRSDALTTTIESLLRTNPERAGDIAAKHMDTIAEGMLRGFSASGSDYRQRWDLLSSLPAGQGRNKVLAKYFEDILRYHGADTERMWGEISPDIRRALVEGGFTGSSLGTLDSAEGTPEKLEGLHDLLREQAERTGNPGKLLTSGALREWAEAEPAAAITWAQQQLKGEKSVNTVAAMFGPAAEKDFAVALQQWQALPEGILRARAAGHLAAAASAAHEAEVAALMNSLSASDQALATAAKLAEQRTRGQLKQLKELMKGPRPQG